ncbi:MAG: hypothetical protein DRO23_10290 [Thermoprotei archaeon]|nr:MAG: hypothetical protein DRO23_10290 [Thermoprotei archaeon]
MLLKFSLTLGRTSFMLSMMNKSRYSTIKERLSMIVTPMLMGVADYCEDGIVTTYKLGNILTAKHFPA